MPLNLHTIALLHSETTFKNLFSLTCGGPSLYTMQSSWDSLSLAFSNEDLESHYSRYLAIYTFANVDRNFAYFGGIFTGIVFGVAGLCGLVPSENRFIAAVLVICGGTVLVGLNRNHRSWYLKHRTPIVMILRTVRIAAGVYAFFFSSVVRMDGPR